MSVQPFLESLRENLHSSANVKTICGEPLEAQGKTIITVARIAYGFGGGSGRKRTGNHKAALTMRHHSKAVAAGLLSFQWVS